MKNLFKSKFILIFILISLLNFAPSVHAQDILDITEFPAVGGLYGITNGNDGNIWITATSGVSEIWKFTSDGISTVFPVPTTLNYSALGPGITSGPDGNIWFTESETNKIGKITPNGTITEYSIPTNNSKPMYITTDSNGNLWFTEQSGNKIGKITISGIITEFSLPTPGEAPWGNTPTGITDGHDGNIWFTEYGANKIGRITPNGSITEFPIPNNAHNNPWVIISGLDGILWFAEGDTEANKIGR